MLVTMNKRGAFEEDERDKGVLFDILGEIHGLEIKNSNIANREMK